MKIPIFISSPTSLNDDQKKSRQIVLQQLALYGLEERRLGQSDYPTELPLREVLVIAKHCAVGVILGFEQIHVTKGLLKPGTDAEKDISETISIPTPWNNLEAGILFALQLPLLIFKEKGVSGGVFDNGVTDVFVHNLPKSNMTTEEEESLRAVFLKWQAKVRQHYYA